MGGAAAAIQSAWIPRQEGIPNAKKVKAQIVVDNSFEANSSVPQTFTHTGGEKKAIPRGAEKTSKKKKGGKYLAVQTAEREDGAVIMNQKSCRNKAKQVRILEEEQQVNAQIVVDHSFEANSSVPQTFMHTGGEKKAIPRGAEKTSKKTKGGKDLAVQTAEPEDGAVIMNQKSCRNKAKQVRILEEEQQQKFAQKALAKPSDKEGAAAAIQSAWIPRQEGTPNAKKVKAQIVDNSFEANSSVPQTFTHTGGEK